MDKGTWKITESIGSQRVRHDCAANTFFKKLSKKNGKNNNSNEDMYIKI